MQHEFHQFSTLFYEPGGKSNLYDCYMALNEFKEAKREMMRIIVITKFNAFLKQHIAISSNTLTHTHAPVFALYT